MTLPPLPLSPDLPFSAWLPALGRWVEPIVELQLYCPTLRYIQAQLRPSIVQHTLLRDTGMYQHEHEPANDGTLPQPLVDVGTPLPYLIDREVMEQERKTVYWYYRLMCVPDQPRVPEQGRWSAAS